MKRLLLTIAALFAVSAAAPATAASSDLYGVWRNPKNSVHVDIRPCGDSACGHVVWASPKARADAREGSGRELVGLQLLRDFAPVQRGWRGKVFVPDLNMTLTGTAKKLDDNHLEARGCLLKSVLCKSQIWTRVAETDRAQLNRE